MLNAVAHSLLYCKQRVNGKKRGRDFIGEEFEEKELKLK
jgi:hypothetical protein